MHQNRLTTEPTFLRFPVAIRQFADGNRLSGFFAIGAVLMLAGLFDFGTEELFADAAGADAVLRQLVRLKFVLFVLRVSGHAFGKPPRFLSSFLTQVRKAHSSRAALSVPSHEKCRMDADVAPDVVLLDEGPDHTVERTNTWSAN
jgi:hypothetical protein